LRLSHDTLADRLRVAFEDLSRTRDLRVVGSVNLLKALAREYPVCVVSGSPRADVAKGIRQAGIERELQFYLASEDYAPGKPDPACFLMGARRLGVAAGSCLVFEDSAAGVQAAKGAGMFCIALARPGRPPQNVGAADQVLDDLSKFCLQEFVSAQAGGAATARR
jgi:beta-phosphoglucomutase-like phosphatase (HAD superfamily)